MELFKITVYYSRGFKPYEFMEGLKEIAKKFNLPVYFPCIDLLNNSLHIHSLNAEELMNWVDKQYSADIRIFGIRADKHKGQC